jgi:glucose 1-dehydrogenase
MKRRFEDKVILVTGSSTGIGRTTAKRFAKEGGILIVHGPKDSDDLLDTFSEIEELSPGSIKVACELSDSNSIRQMFKTIQSEFTKIDILVNNAAAQNSTPFFELTEENWDYVLAVNLKAPFLTSQLAAKMMKDQGGGKIINVGSVHEYQTKRHYTHYSTSKGGLAMLTKNLALELAEYNIQVNQVAPGAIATRLTDEKRQEQFLTAVPAKRVGKADEIASMILYLASSEADYITGVSMTVDGGLTLGFCASRPDL